MVKANKKSLDAKAYINGQVNEMRGKFTKAYNEGTKKQLVENLRETTSSDEYKENLKVVNEDARNTRKNAKMKKGGNITSEEFKKSKTEFYGKDMSLDFGDDFEKLDFGKKVDYIFEKFGDTDYAADLIINLMQERFNNVDHDFYLPMITNILEDLNDGKKLEDKGQLHWVRDAYEYYDLLNKKFGNGVLTIRLYFYLGKILNRRGTTYRWFKEGLKSLNSCKNITETTLKRLFKTKEFSGDGDLDLARCLKNNEEHQHGLINIINGCEDGSVSDAGLIKIFVDMFHGKNLSRIIKKLSPEGQKHMIDCSIKKHRGYCWAVFHQAYYYYQINKNNINLGEGVDVLDYIINSMLNNLDDVDLERFCKGSYGFNHSDSFLSEIEDRHEQIADLFIKAGKIELIKKYINNFTGISGEKKKEIMGK